ncbi:ABC transporter permease [Actinocrispum wychmicini]|uniref:Putative ABC transport system permease protein n=1 Tax=Actinocrispum wychmicini TaxID=1213861 RepID=A0A4R2JRW8_9PSEU|nr:FtsX-like permease family protein [Actinocrispum wychmicini]TCO62304.1 putative ABC transport system permease protein [Actinocrispum wychmicini]
MIGRLALRTVRGRTTSYIASAGAMFAGTALLTAFAALAETGLADRLEALTMLAFIMGGWTVVIVAFGVVSTVSLVVQQRERELALLRTIGTTPGQVRRMVVLETVAVAIPAVLLGILPGIGLGSFVHDRIAGLGVIVGDDLVATWRTALAGAAISLVAAVLASIFAGRRAARVAPVRALAEADSPDRVLTRTKLWIGSVFVLVGIGTGAGTLAMPNGPLLAASAGPACIATAIGLALLSPAIVAAVGRVVSGPAGSAGLALRNLDARASRAGAIVGPLTLLVGIAVGTLYMQSTEDSTAATRPPDDVSAQLAAANYMVVAMIIAFCAIAVTNSLIAATVNRRREFGLLRLTASTRQQVMGMVAVETTVLALVGIVLGSLAALTTTIPYSLVKTGSPVPSGPLWMYLAVIAGAVVISAAATLLPTLRATRERPILALAG